MTTDILVEKQQKQRGGRNIPLSALGGGEGRARWGEPPSRTAELPTSPSRPRGSSPRACGKCRAGPLPLPPQAGGEGKGSR